MTILYSGDVMCGDEVTFVVNRNINVSNVCTVGCAFCGFGQGRRSPDAYEHSEAEFRRRVREAVEFGAEHGLAAKAYPSLKNSEVKQQAWGDWQRRKK